MLDYDYYDYDIHGEWCRVEEVDERRDPERPDYELPRYRGWVGEEVADK